MRTLTDDGGRTWDVTVGRESWGTLVLLFSPRDGSGARTSLMRAETAREAETALGEMDEAELRRRLAESKPWGAEG